jgi:hypothetical protein
MANLHNDHPEPQSDREAVLYKQYTGVGHLRDAARIEGNLAEVARLQTVSDDLARQIDEEHAKRPAKTKSDNVEIAVHEKFSDFLEREAKS